MNHLMNAASQSFTSTNNPDLDVEDKVLIHTMRKTLVECFLSIVNGLKEDGSKVN